MQAQQLADLFWRRWVKEYLPLLQERQKWFTKKQNLQVNDPRANGAKRRSGRKPGARVTNSALAEFKVVAHGSKGGGMSCHDTTLTVDALRFAFCHG